MSAVPVDRESGTPPWRQVAADLRRRVTGGEWTGRLPSERDLAYEYEVNFKVVRKAIAQLREEGLVVTHHGYGTFTAGGGGG